MATVFIIAGRRELPGGNQPWEVELANDDDDDEAVVYTPVSPASKLEKYVRKTVGFQPVSIVLVNAGDCTEVVAEVLASALDGVAFCNYDSEVSFDGAGRATPCESRSELENRIKQAFRHPEPYFARWEREAQERYTEQFALDPELVKSNDWSDV